MDTSDSQGFAAVPKLAVVGQGRLGTAIVRGFAAAGADVDGPFGRGADGSGYDAVLLCVPDSEIAAAAALIVEGPLVGHCSGATGLQPLSGREAFSLHPLMTVTADTPPRFAGAGAAVAGSSPVALALARSLATMLGMDAFEVQDADRAAYHAAACIASNFLITLEAGAERLARDAGVARTALLPLVRETVENWAALGPERALTGPVARDDQRTVAAQRRAVAEREPDLLGLFDAMTEATRELAGAVPSERRMEVVRTVADVRAALVQPRRAGARIGLVPTMGAFHDGHLSLMRRARSECDVVVVSLFVNPTQFDDASDLAVYPRDETRDLELAAACGVDLVFAPSPAEIYPDGFATTVSVSGLTERLEGTARGRAHFDAVATVVTKLLNIVGPDVAHFGAKDYQQALVVRRLVSDLNLPVQIEVCPIVRESSGLAMSSRNAHLNASERERAAALHRALQAAAQSVAQGEHDADAVLAPARAELAGAGIDPEYLEIVASDTLEAITHVNGTALALVAARIGETRLIDNQMLSTSELAGSSRQGK